MTKNKSDFDLSIRIAGEAGQGIQTIGALLCRIIRNCGWEFIANQDYMSRVRGGNNSYSVRISHKRVGSLKSNIDILLPLNGQSVALHRSSLTKGGRIVLDKNRLAPNESDVSFFDVPLQDIALKQGDARYAGSVALGVISGMLGIDREIIEKTVKDFFASKGPAASEANVACGREGYDLGKKEPYFPGEMPAQPDSSRVLCDGNEAVALGAVYAGCRFYSGYPMTPSTTIMETMAGFSNELPLIVEQAEDEIAAINMVIGASYAGVRAMTATSGGGFALMTEGVSLAAMLETPVVIVNGQRPGPATGLPTKTEQSDLDQVLHAGHGEFARVVYAPGNLEEAFELTVRAFDVADRFQIPVIILTDQYLADMVTPAALPGNDLPRIRHVLPRSAPEADGPYLRYKLTETGISPRAVPSWISGVVYADSDEHSEEGHITEDGALRTAMVDKRFINKMTLLAKEVIAPSAENIAQARFIVLGFGSTKGVIEEVCAAFEQEKVGCIHFPQVWPFPSEALASLLAQAPDAHLITVENNAAGQLARLIQRESKIVIEGSIKKYDGRPFTYDDLFTRLEEYRSTHGTI
jgi:2-oxoglutarate ferredoxin oxidoreductase subunit alpha